MKFFDNALTAALLNYTTSTALCVRIIRADGVQIKFAQVEGQVIIEDEVFAEARGISIASIPFELNGGSTRFDIYVAAQEHGIINARDVRNGLYDGAQMVAYLVDRNNPETLENVLFVGALGQMTVTEQGYVTIECVGLLERAMGLFTEQYTPVCRADFGDARCKVPLAPLTHAATVTGQDGYHLTVAGLSGDALTSGFFKNGELIFRSGLLINQAYEILSNSDSDIGLFTPTEFPPQVGDMVDIIRGCDHSPFADGCLKYSNILNYRGEPWAPGEMVEQDLQWITPDFSVGSFVGPVGGDDLVGIDNGPPNGPNPPDEPKGDWPFYFSVDGEFNNVLKNPSELGAL